MYDESIGHLFTDAAGSVET